MGAHFCSKLQRADIKRILEIGCGAGDFSIALAKMGKDVVAVDLSRRQIERAKQKASQEGVLQGIEFIAGDVLQQEFGRTFDAVIAWSSIHHFPDIDKLLTKLDTLLNSNGLMVFHEPLQHCFNGYSQPVAVCAEYLKRKMGRLFFSPDKFLDNDVQELLLGESPAGCVAHQRSFSLEQILTLRYHIAELKYSHIVTPCIADIFCLYAKNKLINKLFRKLLPWLLEAEKYLCAIPGSRRYCMYCTFVLQKKVQEGVK